MPLRVFIHDHHAAHAADDFFNEVRKIWKEETGRQLDIKRINKEDMYDNDKLNMALDIFNFENNGARGDTHLLIAHMDDLVGIHDDCITIANNGNGAIYFILISHREPYALSDPPYVMSMGRDPEAITGLERFVRHLVKISKKTRPEVNLRLLLPNPIPEATLAYKLVLLAKQWALAQQRNIQMPDDLEDKIKAKFEAEFKKAGKKLPQKEDSIEDKIDAVINKNYGKKSE